MGWQEEDEALKRKRASTKRKLTRKVTLFKEGVDIGDDLSVLNINYEDVLEAFKCLESINDELINFIWVNNMDGNLEEEAQQYILDSERSKNEARAVICKFDSHQNNTSRTKVKLKAFEPPKFDGNLREYPNFKEDFNNLVKECVRVRSICSESVSQ
ncbi:hypothetical protein Pcinc_003144 [Petrolisthes cinctipes]|uniref:Uncharacterized protein n=1 Tax=Petrolisthes cinctipes TaxID=88211 RepID=A0AAE1GHR1_PETCI|nr:hypothetical protein Pcinc_003144 [Petrolisthes cinctipes]